MTQCTCERCDECDGAGNIWRGFNGQYLGKHRMDDLDELEKCPECDGTGILMWCEDCLQAEEEAAGEDIEQWFGE